MGTTRARLAACAATLIFAFGACNVFTGADDYVIGDDDSGSSSSSGSGQSGVGGSGTGSGGAGTGAGVNTDGLLPSDAASISSVEIYQGVRKPLMEFGGPASSNVPLVAGREALMRIYYTIQQPVTVTTVVTIGSREPIVATSSLTGTPSTSSLPSTINVTIPADMMVPGAGYSVELLENPEVTTGTNPGAVYPAQGQEGLNISDVGPLKVVLVPIAYGADGSNRVPDPQVNNYKTRFQSLYPVPDVEIEVHSTFQWNSTVAANGSGWGSLLDAIQSLRQQSGAASNDHYYGIFMPASSFSAYCSGGCVAGLSYLAASAGDAYSRAGIGMGFSGGGSTETAAHEIGHQHGREHAPCQVNDADPSFPHSGGVIGEWGYDLIRGELVSPQTTDFMSYCNPTWVSDYTYSALFNRLVAVNGSASWQYDPNLLDRTYERIRIDVDGATWTDSVTLHAPPLGELKTVTITDEQGARDVTGWFYPYSHIEGGVLLFLEQDRTIQRVAFDIGSLEQVVERPKAVAD